MHLLNSALSTGADDSRGSGGGKGGPASQWFILDGSPTPNQMETMAACCLDESLTLSNGHSVPLDSSIRFIFEVDKEKYTSILDMYTLAQYSRPSIL